jgi:hypothetical protein
MDSDFDEEGAAHTRKKTQDGRAAALNVEGTFKVNVKDEETRD